MNIKKGHKMYPKMLSILVTISLCMGLMPNTNVCAAELPEETKGCIAITDDIGTGDDPASRESEITAEEIEIPQNGSEVHMKDIVKTQPPAIHEKSIDETVYGTCTGYFFSGRLSAKRSRYLYS